MKAAIRLLAAGDSLALLTDLLHRAYAPLGARSLNYTAVDQTVETTAHRVTHLWRGVLHLVHDGVARHHESENVLEVVTLKRILSASVPERRPLQREKPGGARVPNDQPRIDLRFYRGLDRHGVELTTGTAHVLARRHDVERRPIGRTPPMRMCGIGDVLPELPVAETIGELASLGVCRGGDDRVHVIGRTDLGNDGVRLQQRCDRTADEYHPPRQVAQSTRNGRDASD